MADDTVDAPPMTRDEAEELKRRYRERHDGPYLIDVPIRPGVVVKVQYPFDITQEEASKVARVLMALAGKDDPTQ